MSTSVMSALWQYAYLVARKELTFEQSMRDCRTLIQSRIKDTPFEPYRSAKEQKLPPPPSDVSCPLFAWIRLAQRLEQDLFKLRREGSLVREQVGQVFLTFLRREEGGKLRLSHEGVAMVEEPPGVMEAIMYAQMTGQADLHINVLREWAISLALANRHGQAIRLGATACASFKDLMEASGRDGHAQAVESYRYWGLDTAKHFSLTDYGTCQPV